MEESILNEQPDLKIQAMYFMPAEGGYHFAVLTEEGFSGSVPMDRNTYQRIEKENGVTQLGDLRRNGFDVKFDFTLVIIDQGAQRREVVSS